MLCDFFTCLKEPFMISHPIYWHRPFVDTIDLVTRLVRLPQMTFIIKILRNNGIELELIDPATKVCWKKFL